MYGFIEFLNYKRSWIRTVWNCETCQRSKYAASLCFKANFEKFSKKRRFISLHRVVKKNSSKDLISFYRWIRQSIFR